MGNQDIQERWDHAMARLAFRVNLGWWLQRWLPLAMALGLASAAGLLALRMLGLPYLQPAWIVIASLMIAAGALAWVRAHGSFETKTDARIRLEDALNLKARLSAAAGGVAPWPDPPLTAVPMPVSWRWQRPLAGLACCAALLVLAVLLPVPSRAGSQARIIEKPGAVRELESWLEALRKDNAVKPENVEEVREKIEDLLKRPSDQWYEHASLEAADHLRDETGRQLQELGASLEQARGSLSTLQQMGGTLSQESRQGLQNQLQQNLQGLRSGAMQAGDDLMKQLQGLDPQSMQGMSKEDLDKLQERLKQNADALHEALANAPQFSFKETPVSKDGKNHGSRDVDDDADPARGRGDADLTLKRDETNLHTKDTEPMKPAIDLERVAPGDLLGTNDAAPKVGQNAALGANGGRIGSTGEGGAAIFKESLLPAEREVLRRYFK